MHWREVFRPRSISARLRSLVLALVLPMLAVSLIAGLAVYLGVRASAIEGARSTARALSIVVDREMSYRAAVLRTLGASRTLDGEDLSAFADIARDVAAGTDAIIVLRDEEGRVRMSTDPKAGNLPPPLPLMTGPPAAPAGRLTDAPSLPWPPQVSSLYLDAGSTVQYSFAVQVPVVREGRLRGFLALVSRASQLQRIFEEQSLATGWTGVVLDARGVAAARNVDAPRIVGLSASADMLSVLAQRSAGEHSTRTLDGTSVITAFDRAPLSRWRVLIGVPSREIEAAALRAVGGMLAAFALLMAVGLWAAARAGRRIAEPVQRLRRDAEAIGRGERIAPAPTGLEETDAVQALLAQASVERGEADERLQARVREAVADAERAQHAVVSAQKLEALGRLTGGIAHDFNNLLQTMTTGLHLAARLSADPRAQKALAACEGALGKAVKLTRQLMTFGRGQTVNREVIDPAARLRAMHDLLRGALRESITLRERLDAQVWPLDIDPVQFEMAILNIAMNARDAITGAGVVEISVRNTQLREGEVPNVPAGDMVMVSMRDDGPGIDPQILPRVFDPFFTTKPVGKGSGLGLAQVYGFARQAGGGVTIDSRPGAGTELRLYLPRSRAPVHHSPSQIDAHMPSRHAGVVLLVEDDALLRGITGQALEDFGFGVVPAGDARSALALLEGGIHCDAVLADVMMPGAMDGFALARELHRRWPTLPVLLASGYAEVAQRDHTVPVIAKPYDVHQVAQALATQMKKRQDEQSAAP